MNRSTDQALRSLLPTHNGAFPPQLAELAGSLLAQSRHRASTLKAEEEIARPYACAHIACDRLKTGLNLPPIDARPPIPPRLYKRLYTHLCTILQPGPGGPSGSRTASDSLGSPVKRRPGRPPKSASAASTPTKRTYERPTLTPSRQTARRAAAANASIFPPWLRPTVRFVCDELHHPQLAPTVVAGLSSIHRDVAANQKKPQRGLPVSADGDGKEEINLAWVDANLTALTAAIYYYCAASWQTRQAGGGPGGIGNIEQSRYTADEKAIQAAFRKARTTVQLPEGVSEDWEAGRWQDLSRRNFRDALLVVSEKQWLQGDWFQDIQHVRKQGGGVDGNDEDAGDVADDDDENTGSIPTQMWRADSMFQARYDFLSETKQVAYDQWKAGILQQIASQNEPAGRGEPMQVDA